MKEFFQKIKNSFRKDILIKLAALFFAFILWNYVLTDTNPQRNTTIGGLSVNVLNEDVLTKNQLVVTEGLSNLVNNVNVVINVQKNYLDYVTEDNVSVEADLSNIKEPGTYEINLRAKTTYGSIASISPSTANIVVEKVVQSTLPIECVFVGEDNDDIYISEPKLDHSEIVISGPSSIISTISRAVCYIDKDSLKTSDSTQSATLQISFINDEDVTIDESVVQKFISADSFSVVASYNVTNKKTVSVDLSSSLLNADKIKSGYELKSATPDPANVTIIGDADVINSIESLKVKPINLYGISSDTIKSSKLIVPNGVTVLEGNDVNVNVQLQSTE